MKVIKIFLLLSVFILLSLFLKNVASIAVPIVFGALLGFVFSSVVGGFKQRKVPVVLTIPLTIIFFLIISFVFVSIVAISINSINDRFSFYQERAISAIKILSENMPFIQGDLLLQLQNGIFSFLTRMLVSFSKGLIGVTSSFVIALFVMTFVLLERYLLSHKLIRVFKKDIHRARKVLLLINNVNTQVSRFILLKSLISLSTGGIIYIAFLFIGVDFPLAWAILTFVLNFIPSVGSIIVTMASILFAFLQFSPSWGGVIAVMTVTILTQTIIGNVLDPLLIGDRLNLSPLVIFLSLLYWGLIWGPAGMLLSTPITVTIRVLLEMSQSTCSWGVAMANSRFMNRGHLSFDIRSSTHNNKKNLKDNTCWILLIH